MLDMAKFNLTRHDEELVSLIKKTNQKALTLWAIGRLSPFYLTIKKNILMM